ncbi:helix-turn-helix domain-containing protein [Geodermatophilus sp. URMC 63]
MAPDPNSRTGDAADPAGDPASDVVRRLDDPDFPALTMSQAATLLGVQAAFLRSLDGSGVLQPHRSPGGHRRYSRHQLQLAARLRGLLDEGHTLASAEVILGLQDELADARATSDRLRDTVDRLRAGDDDAPSRSDEGDGRRVAP